MKSITDGWYRASAMTVALRPFSWLFRALIVIRRAAYVIGVLRATRLDVPVIVVGNITVGGTGKTPLVIWLVDLLKREGFSPGIVSRGYKGRARRWPQQVRPDSDPVIVGDEAIVMAKRCGCPIAVGPARVAAAKALLHYHDCDIIVSDDGLQHYALGRDIEIAVIDGARRFGNGYCLPAGPLREPVSRLRTVDFVIVNEGAALQREYPMTMGATRLCNVKQDTQSYPPERFPHRRIHAVAGIGNPERFFRQLKQLGFDVIRHPFPDHHAFTAPDIAFDDGYPVVMTEKDAVKCRRFCGDACWYLSIDARPDPRLEPRLLSKIRDLRQDNEYGLKTLAAK